MLDIHRCIENIGFDLPWASCTYSHSLKSVGIQTVKFLQPTLISWISNMEFWHVLVAWCGCLYHIYLLHLPTSQQTSNRRDKQQIKRSSSQVLHTNCYMRSPIVSAVSRHQFRVHLGHISDENWLNYCTWVNLPLKLIVLINFSFFFSWCAQ